MHSLTYRIRIMTPVIISVVGGDMNMVKTEKYIPGTTVLGMLAKRFIDNPPGNKIGKEIHTNDTFYNWFLAGSLKIGDANILPELNKKDSEYHATPFSIEKEKYQEFIYDYLFIDTDKNNNGNDSSDLEKTEQMNEDTEYLGNFSDLGDRKHVAHVDTRIEFHHKRDRLKGISESGKIFNYESIMPNQVFSGKIRGEEKDLEELVKICGMKWGAFIGRSKNAQYGAVEFEFEQQLGNASGNFDWPKEYEDTDEDEEIPSKPASIISMTLQSDLILYNEYGFPTTDVGDIEELLKKHIGEVKIKKAFVKSKRIENFVGVWRLKRPVDVCFAAGSTFLLDVTSDKQNKLVEIQRDGLGERTHEGFGRCMFGLQTQAMPGLPEVDKQKIKQPSGSIPDATVGIVEKIITDILTEQIKLNAIHKQEEFKRLPSAALISRLYGIAKETKGNRPQLVKNINMLRRTAMDQLRRCVSRKYNLLEFLAQFKLEQEKITELETNFNIAENKKKAIIEFAANKSFVLVDVMRDHIKLSKDDKFKNEEMGELLELASFENNPMDVEQLFIQPTNDKLKKLRELIGINNPEKNKELKKKLTAAYYDMFFDAMRKRKIAEGDEYVSGR